MTTYQPTSRLQNFLKERSSQAIPLIFRYIHILHAPPCRPALSLTLHMKDHRRQELLACLQSKCRHECTGALERGCNSRRVLWLSSDRCRNRKGRWSADWWLCQLRRSIRTRLLRPPLRGLSPDILTQLFKEIGGFLCGDTLTHLQEVAQVLCPLLWHCRDEMICDYCRPGKTGLSIFYPALRQMASWMRWQRSWQALARAVQLWSAP